MFFKRFSFATVYEVRVAVPFTLPLQHHAPCAMFKTALGHIRPPFKPPSLG